MRRPTQHISPQGNHQITRRRFAKLAAAGTSALLAAPGIVRARNLNDKLNIAIIGAGGRGGSNTNGVSSENIVALCDVYQPAVDKAGERFPEAKKFADFRQVLDRKSVV